MMPSLLRRLAALLPLLLLAVPPAQAQAQQGDPSFTLVNRSGQVINEIYVSPTREPNWGRDLLGQSTLANGRSFPVRIAPSAGCRQDIRVVYADGRPEERRNQDTCAITEMVFGTAAPRAPQAGASPNPGGNPSFNLVNRGRAAIREIYVSSARDNDWGPDRLGQNTLPIGQHLPVQLPQGDCVNDIRIVWMDGRPEERRAVDTCQLVNVVFP
ncbi:hypothetical protein [Falsiroseomonas ponticola]|uniref:hypothetical protein n=1 Tax=Falsiroseomonas ponticola TaxID=2786951 RepID=UPI001933FBF6|nr:hypothetical protein [Roseomonas ponticola]